MTQWLRQDYSTVQTSRCKDGEEVWTMDSQKTGTIHVYHFYPPLYLAGELHTDSIFFNSLRHFCV